MNIQTNLSPRFQATLRAAYCGHEHKKCEGESEPDQVEISYFPQDPGMIPAQKGKMDRSDVGDNLSGPRLRVSEPRNFPQPKAENGNFIVAEDDPRMDATNTFYVAHKTLEMSENYAGRDLPWSFTEELGREEMLVRPHAGGSAMNAFYTSEGGSINFFHYKDEQNGYHRTSLHSDVVAHETGHAILDAMRPVYMESLSVPAGGYHEAFGDMVAMLKALHEETVVDALFTETRGDISNSNVASRIAESLGFHAYGKDSIGATGQPSLRDMVNDHQYVDQHFLPYVDGKSGSDFGTEPHAYANLFTGAFYDVFQGIYEDSASDPARSFNKAVSTARDAAGKLLFRATDLSPVGNPSYPEMAVAFLKADALDNNGKYRPILEQAFRDRGLLTDQSVAEFDQSMKDLPEIELKPEALKSEKGAEKFLRGVAKKLKLPEGTKFEFVNQRTTDAGETFLTFKTHRDEILDDPDFGMHEGSKFRGVGGLALLFGADNKLKAATLDEVTNREMDNIRDYLRTAIQGGYMVTGDGNGHSEHGKLHVEVFNDGSGPVLRRAPVLYC